MPYLSFCFHLLLSLHVLGRDESSQLGKSFIRILVCMHGLIDDDNDVISIQVIHCKCFLFYVQLIDYLFHVIFG